MTLSGTAATVGCVPWGPEQGTVNGLSSTTQGQEQGFPQAAQWVMNPSTKQEIQEMWARSLEREDPRRRKWQPTPLFLPGESYGQRSLAGYSPWVGRVGHDLATKPPKMCY